MTERLGYIAIVLIAVLTIACGRSEPAPVPTTATPIMIVVTATPEPVPTLAPPTQIPLPTYTPYPTYTPISQTLAPTEILVSPTYTPYPRPEPLAQNIVAGPTSTPTVTPVSALSRLVPEDTPTPVIVQSDCHRVETTENVVIPTDMEGYSDKRVLFGDTLTFQDNAPIPRKNEIRSWTKGDTPMGGYWLIENLTHEHCIHIGPKGLDTSLTIDGKDIPPIPDMGIDLRIRLVFTITPAVNGENLIDHHSWFVYRTTKYNREQSDGGSGGITLVPNQGGTIWMLHGVEQENSSWQCIVTDVEVLRDRFCQGSSDTVMWDGTPQIMVIVN